MLDVPQTFFGVKFGIQECNYILYPVFILLCVANLISIRSVQCQVCSVMLVETGTASALELAKR